MSTQPRWHLTLPLIFSVIALSFVAATAFGHWRLRAIDRAALAIAEDAAPGIEHLVAARAEVRRLRSLVRGYVEEPAAGSPDRAEAITESRSAIDRSIDAYLALPLFADERDLWAAIAAERARLDAAAERCLSDVAQGELAAGEIAFRSLSAAADALGEAISEAIELDASRSHDLALQIRSLRGRAMVVAFSLDAACVLITIAAAIGLRRAIRAYTRLNERHQRLLEERAHELEQFAGRVAHDILSPLGAVSLALQVAARREDPEMVGRSLTRGSRALDRVTRLVRGLLEFARAGANPQKGARASVADTIADMVPDLEVAAADAKAELHVDVRVRTAAPCNAGVLTSIVANLARNAIKYIGDGPRRRIDVRAVELDGALRVEVQDTGPGLAPGLEARVFEPYVRDPRATQAGIGLGLATVKRLVEAHGGKVGVRSVPGEGCTFWFELPAAPAGELAVSAPPSDALRAAR